jgi:hypothetical protein
MLVFRWLLEASASAAVNLDVIPFNVCSSLSVKKLAALLSAIRGYQQSQIASTHERRGPMGSGATRPHLLPEEAGSRESRETACDSCRRRSSSSGPRWPTSSLHPRRRWPTTCWLARAWAACRHAASPTSSRNFTGRARQSACIPGAQPTLTLVANSGVGD